MRFPRHTGFSLLSAAAIGVLLASCIEEVPPEGEPIDFALADLDELMEGAPADLGMSIPFDSKADEVLPPQFNLMQYQSPVRSQGSRGTCTIFATAALMESLYVHEGTLMNPDFSEQFLQWSAKFEVNSFPTSAGSNPNYNLQAINRHGIVLESLWPYENREWGVTNDPACTGMMRPTRCFTNGVPPATALAGQRFTLPRGRYINPSARSLKGHMFSTRTGIVASGTFFYQAWNHGGSMLTTNRDYTANGWVLSPNTADVRDSGLRPAGHGIQLLGWDDDLAVQTRNERGEPVVDAAGNPVMERGFFLFKNSWGTGNFGSLNPHGSGYGWISYRYVEAHMTGYVSALPTVMVAEVCNDGRDNDRNGASDCDDVTCSTVRECMDPEDNYSNTTALMIPDNAPTGASNSITVTEGGTISSLAITVDLTHTYRGDVRLALVREDSSQAVFFDRVGGSADDVRDTFSISAFNGTDAAGVWTVRAVDLARGDLGTLNSWSLDITRCMVDCTGTPMVATYRDEANAPIADLSTLTRTINVPSGGEIEALDVSFDIDHSFPLDLTIRLRQTGGREVVLVTEDSSGGTSLNRRMSVPAFVGDTAAGAWVLTVVDGATGDTGTLRRWSLEVTTR